MSGCSEAELGDLARGVARELGRSDWVLLEGPLGAGKSTFARAMLESLGVDRPPEGSPTFAIAHEYRRTDGLEVVHLDLFRIRSEEELEQAGVHAYFWERDALVLSEWVSNWPVVRERLISSRGRSRRVWCVTLKIPREGIEGERRDVVVEVVG